MPYSIVMLVGLSVAQPPAATPSGEYIPINSRTLKLPIKYEKDRRHIRQMKLFVARNGENTWYQEAAVPPDRDHFTFHAKEDGVYWFTMVEEDLQGRQIPADLTRTPPDLKVLIDTTPPRVRLTQLQRRGEEVIAEWVIEDAYPAEARTQVHVRPAGGDAPWQEVRLAPGVYHGVRFAMPSPQALEIRVTAFDLAGNKGEVIQTLPASEANRASATTVAAAAMTTGSPAVPVAPASSSSAVGVDQGPFPPPAPLAPAGPISPAVGPLPPAGPPAVPPAAAGGPTSGAPATGPVPPAVPPPSSLPAATPASTTAGTTASSVTERPLPTIEPRSTSAPAAPSPAAMPVWSSNSGGTAGPHVEESRATVINYLAFDLAYEVEARGPSGLSRLDLWVTRDDGRTWMKWSQHDPRGSTIRVNLHQPSNPQLEGSYGFRIVPISGAGLSEREPVSGDAPELRVIVDVTPPQVEIYPPVGDPQQPHTLLLQWKATDKHWGAHPILLEWSDKPNGPWQPVVSSTSEVQPAAAASPASVATGRWLPNTGSYAWRVPAGLPPRVYLKVTARDAAGNVREVVTRDPILVDLVKPKARISGIVGPVPPSTPPVPSPE
ncbi:MAG: hypothetical protein RMJ88_00710 [Thermogemmata sp.]|nr:hypothetical protein [Thermogemmata sp.]